MHPLLIVLLVVLTFFYWIGSALGLPLWFNQLVLLFGAIPFVLYYRRSKHRFVPCPSCQGACKIPRKLEAGQRVICSHCAVRFLPDDEDAPVLPPLPVNAIARDGPTVCPLCRDKLLDYDRYTECEQCDTRVHNQCIRELGKEDGADCPTCRSPYSRRHRA